MAVNLIDVLKNAFTDNVYESIARKVGLDASTAKSGVGAIIPTVLGSILGKNTVGAYNQPSWWDSIVDFFDGDDEDLHISKVDDPSFLKTGSGMVSGLFGTNHDSIVGAIGQSIGAGKEKASGLMGMVVPMITGYLGNWMKRKSWSFKDLISNLIDNKSSIMSALPASISPALLGFSAPVADAPRATHTRPVETKREPVQEPRKGGSNWLWWLLAILLIGLLLWWLLGNKGCSKHVVDNDADTLVIDDKIDTMATNAGNAIKGALNDAGDWIYDLGANVNRKLKDGKELVIGENSVENRLIDFIESDKPVDKTTWFSFDRLYFETGSSKLKAESEAQLQNIADIMKAYPEVHMKMGGYTDNTGSEDLNMNLSQERANAAMNELVKLGVDKARLEAEGYGSQHPIASNDTPEGRAQNRRIDVRVTQK